VEAAARNRNRIMANKLPHHIVTATVAPVHVARIEQREIRGAATPEIDLPDFATLYPGYACLLLTFGPLEQAEHRRPRRTGPEGGKAGAEAFLPRQGWRVKKPHRGREAQGTGQRLLRCPAQRRGPVFFGYFLLRQKKVTRAAARNSGSTSGNQWFQHTMQTLDSTPPEPNPSGYAMKPLSRPTRAIDATSNTSGSTR